MKVQMVDVDNIQDTDFVLHRENGCCDYLFVLFKSPARVLTNGEYVSVDSGKCILFDKHKIQSYHPIQNQKFIHDFIHLDTENSFEEILLSDIPKGSLIDVSLPYAITGILSEIKAEMYNSIYKHKRDIITNLGIAFLYRIKSEVEARLAEEKGSPYFSALYNLRSELYNNPGFDWSIDTMCRQACLSRSYFQFIYKRFFGISCNEDIIRARVLHAKLLLASSNLKVYEIAEKCGYSNAEHFIRQFRSKTGATPEGFRNM